MLERFVEKSDLLIGVACGDWQEAIDRGAEPLLARRIIEPSYVEAVKKNHRVMPYMVIAPGIMLAHARPECGAHAVGLTMMTLAAPIAFSHETNDLVRLVITLATPDDASHVKMLEALTDFLMQPERLSRFMQAEDAEEAYRILKGED